MIKNHHWIPESVYDFFKWDMHNHLPRMDYGFETAIVNFNLFAQKSYAAWWLQWQTVYPHTLKYRFTKAICQDDINEIKICLDQRSDLLDAELMQGFNALSLASSLNKTGIINYLLFRGADINKKDYQGRTPLIQAVSAWQIEAIKALVESGAQIDVKGLYGFDALELSKQKGYEQISKFLEAKKNVQITKTFPKIQINFEFESLLKNKHIEELIQEKQLFSFQPAVHPFNNYGGRYLINLVKHHKLIEEL